MQIRTLTSSQLARAGELRWKSTPPVIVVSLIGIRQKSELFSISFSQGHWLGSRSSLTFQDFVFAGSLIGIPFKTELFRISFSQGLWLGSRSRLNFSGFRFRRVSDWDPVQDWTFQDFVFAGSLIGIPFKTELFRISFSQGLWLGSRSRLLKLSSWLRCPFISQKNSGKKKIAQNSPQPLLKNKMVPSWRHLVDYIIFSPLTLGTFH